MSAEKDSQLCLLLSLPAQSLFTKTAIQTLYRNKKSEEKTCIQTPQATNIPATLFKSMDGHSEDKYM